jgi:hypothetical protein
MNQDELIVELAQFSGDPIGFVYFVISFSFACTMAFTFDPERAVPILILSTYPQPASAVWFELDLVPETIRQSCKHISHWA